MIGYYARRAREYERIYHKPERQEDLGALRAFVERTFVGQRSRPRRNGKEPPSSSRCRRPTRGPAVQQKSARRRRAMLPGLPVAPVCGKYARIPALSWRSSQSLRSRCPPLFFILGRSFRDGHTTRKAERAAQVVSAHSERQANLFEVTDRIEPLVCEISPVMIAQQVARGHRSAHQDGDIDDAFRFHMAQDLIHLLPQSDLSAS